MTLNIQEGKYFEQPLTKADEDEEETDFGKHGKAGSEFTVKIIGPGMNTTITLGDQDDLVILDAILSKVRKRLEEKES